MSILSKTEEDIFNELRDVCFDDGFIYTYAYLCLKNNFIFSDGSGDIVNWYSPKRLNKNELKTLQGLMLQKTFNIVRPNNELILKQAQVVDDLLNKIHEKLAFINYPEQMHSSTQENDLFANILLKSPNMLREMIFYCAESAYDFQYENFSKLKYNNDEEWIKNNKGFTISEAIDIANSIKNSIMSKIDKLVNNLEIDNILEIFKLNIDDLVNNTKLEKNTIINFINNFVSTKDNSQFRAISDLNDASLTPILKYNDGYYLFNYNVLLEAIYESPMFWIRDEDKKYLNQAEKNRGEFVESITRNFLERVFKKENVYSNVNIYKNGSKNKLGEIDLLVIFGGKALIFQAKSKALTLQSRRGNIDVFQSDFTKGIQKAYDQAVECAIALNLGNITLKDNNDNIINTDLKISRYYPITITSEHFPSLIIQSRHFLIRNKEIEYLNEPFIMDIFFLDIFTEFMNSPLYFISYLERRSNYFDSLLAGSEFTLFSLHLKQNLWVPSEFNMLMVDEDVSMELDNAVQVRRQGVKGKSTPEGILTKYVNTTFHKMIIQIESTEHLHAVDFGLFLLEMSEESVNNFNKLVDLACKLTLSDYQKHDVSLQVKGNSGVTIHSILCESKKDLDSYTKGLNSHITMRKYIAKANIWFGAIIDANTKLLQIISRIESEWVKNEEFEKMIPNRIKDNEGKIEFSSLNSHIINKSKIGRNDKCPCGSGKKYKKCCLN